MSNYNNKENNHSHSITKRIKLMDLTVDRNGRSFNRESLTNILDGFDFTKISVPVFVYKELVFGDGKKGTLIVGHIKKYIAETETFELIIYSNSINTVNSFEDAVVFPRVFIDKETNDVKTILGFDIAPVSFFVEK